MGSLYQLPYARVLESIRLCYNIIQLASIILVPHYTQHGHSHPPHPQMMYHDDPMNFGTVNSVSRPTSTTVYSSVKLVAWI